MQPARAGTRIREVERRNRRTGEQNPRNQEPGGTGPPPGLPPCWLTASPARYWGRSGASPGPRNERVNQGGAGKPRAAGRIWGVGMRCCGELAATDRRVGYLRREKILRAWDPSGIQGGRPGSRPAPRPKSGSNSFKTAEMQSVTRRCHGCLPPVGNPGVVGGWRGVPGGAARLVGH